MSGASDHTTGLSVSTWGLREVPEEGSGIWWQNWRVRLHGQHICDLVLPYDLDAGEALVLAGSMVDLAHHMIGDR